MAEPRAIGFPRRGGLGGLEFFSSIIADNRSQARGLRNIGTSVRLSLATDRQAAELVCVELREPDVVVRPFDDAVHDSLVDRTLKQVTGTFDMSPGEAPWIALSIRMM